jgi:hypothetical protein
MPAKYSMQTGYSQSIHTIGVTGFGGCKLLNAGWLSVKYSIQVGYGLCGCKGLIAGAL